MFKKTSFNLTQSKWLYVIVFFILYFLGDRIISIPLNYLVKSSHFRFSELYRGNNSYQAVIVGNSRGVNSFYVPGINEKLKIKAFNLSYNGMDLGIVKTLLLDYLDSNKTPNLLIIEVSSVFNIKEENKNLKPIQQESENIQPIGLLGDLKPYFPYSKRLKELANRRSSNLILWTNIAHLYQYNGEMFLRIINYLKNSDQDWSNNKTISPALIESTHLEPNYQFEINIDAFKELQEILKIAHSKGIKTRLIIGPYLPDYRKKIINYNTAVQDLKNRLDKIQYNSFSDYSTTITDPKKFADRIHTNKLGSKQLLTELINDDFFK